MQQEERSSQRRIKKPKSVFESYLHKKASSPQVSGEKLVRLVIMTGLPASQLIDFIRGDKEKNAQPPETKKAKRKTPAQVAKKARRRYSYARNKAAAYCAENGLCAVCMDDNDKRPMRECAECHQDVCDYCLPKERDGFVADAPP